MRIIDLIKSHIVEKSIKIHMYSSTGYIGTKSYCQKLSWYGPDVTYLGEFTALIKDVKLLDINHSGNTFALSIEQDENLLELLIHHYTEIDFI